MKILLALVMLLAVPAIAQTTPVIVPDTAACATSIDGSVVGVLNPLQPPVTAVVFSGTLPAGNYFIEETWYDAAANQTLVGPEVQVQLVATGEIQISPPTNGYPATAVGAKIYIGTSSGSETLQGSVVLPGTYTQSIPLVTGAAVPSSNTTQCQIVANDAGWPTGTGYQVSFTAPNGSVQPGYPMQWQLLGPGTTINLGNGLPLYNGTVTYPIPILARPYNHATQSISGPLSMAGYSIAGVLKLGVGTNLAAWGIDVEGAGLNAYINAKGGYLLNGVGGSTGQALCSDGTYLDTFCTFITAGILTTKGDLLGYSTQPARVAVGADGSVLSADSTQATGLAYRSFLNMVEGTAPTAASNFDTFWPDSATHRWKFNPNNAGALFMGGIASAGTAGHCMQLASNGIDYVDAGSVCALSVSQTNVLANRTSGTTYQAGSQSAQPSPSNTPVLVEVVAQEAANCSGSQFQLNATVGASSGTQTLVNSGSTGNCDASNVENASVTFLVPANYFYTVTLVGGGTPAATIIAWIELPL